MAWHPGRVRLLCENIACESCIKKSALTERFFYRGLWPYLGCMPGKNSMPVR